MTSGEQLKKVLNVGGNNKDIPIPECFGGWQHDLLDIDPTGIPDVLCDARELWRLPPRQYDAIYCSHNLEHYFKHEVKSVLKGFRVILKKDGFALIKVPDILGLMQHVVHDGLDIEDVLYVAPGGPILVSDVMYGWQAKIEKSGTDYYAHKFGYSKQSLGRVLKDNGFPFVYLRAENYEVVSYAFLQEPQEEQLKELGLV